MGVFLRWGILGILSVAALLYAYNASKRMAAAHQREAAANLPMAGDEASEDRGAGDESDRTAEPAGEPAEALSPHCEVELLVARRAREMRQQAQPLDRVLRMQEIAWQEPASRRERLEKVATDWYERQAPADEQALREAVVSECEPAP
jgi:hypothetical protein